MDQLLQQSPTSRAQFENDHIVHSYFRSRFTVNGKKMVWACKNPYCSHTLLVPKNDRSILIGKMTLCPQCMETQFILSQEDVKRKTPICANCKGGEERKRVMEKTKNIFDQLFTTEDKEKKS